MSSLTPQELEEAIRRAVGSGSETASPAARGEALAEGSADAADAAAGLRPGSRGRPVVAGAGAAGDAATANPGREDIRAIFCHVDIVGAMMNEQCQVT